MSQLLYTILSLPGIIIGLSFHEAAHAFASDRLGDPTPRRQGRLTINPAAHIDVLGFLALLLCHFGWGRPVQINPAYYKNRRRDEFIVGIAGITANLIIAIIFAFLTRGIYALSFSMGSPEILNLVGEMFKYVVVINLCLMIFNLLPVPPLDGFGLLSQIFNLEKYEWYYTLQGYGSYILIALIVFNITDIVMIPLMNIFLNILL